MTKRAEKVSGFFFSVMGEGKCEINYKKLFFSFRELYNYFLVVSLPEKIIRKCFGSKDMCSRNACESVKNES